MSHKVVGRFVTKGHENLVERLIEKGQELGCECEKSVTEQDYIIVRGTSDNYEKAVKEMRKIVKERGD